MTPKVSVLVCRGCCCGTDKHADVDHDAQLDALAAAVPDGGRLWQVDCLGPCSSSNVVVVRTSARRRWFGHVLEPTATAQLASWIGDGAPDPLPPELEHLVIDPADRDVRFGPLDVSPDELAEFVATSLDTRSGDWSMGVVGAVAEWIPDATTTVERLGPASFAATADGGSLQLHLEGTIRPFAGRWRDGRALDRVGLPRQAGG